MIKTKSLFKYFKNINNSINSLLEKNLNKLNFKNLNYLFKNNKLILIFVAVFVLFVSYLLIPTFYKQSDISKELKTELQNNRFWTFLGIFGDFLGQFYKCNRCTYRNSQTWSQKEPEIIKNDQT